MRSWNLESEVEKLLWNHLKPEQLLVSDTQQYTTQLHTNPLGKRGCLRCVSSESFIFNLCKSTLVPRAYQKGHATCINGKILSVIAWICTCTAPAWASNAGSLVLAIFLHSDCVWHSNFTVSLLPFPLNHSLLCVGHPFHMWLNLRLCRWLMNLHALSLPLSAHKLLLVPTILFRLLILVGIQCFTLFL